jgi:ribonuclease G
MKSGGYLVIEQTEALTSIDINTGKNVGKENARETILKTNLEAAATICEQLKLRNIGGIIIVDFIDMDDPIDREIIYHALVDGLKTDRARTNVLRISELGILQMTRKRTMESMARRHMELCTSCQGAGYVKNLHAESMELIREILRIHATSQTDNLLVQAKPAIVEYLHKDLTDVYGLLISEKRIRVKFEPGFADIDSDKKKSFLVSPLL